MRSAQHFRARYYGDSDSSDGGNEGNEGHDAGPYKFDSPESIGTAVSNTREARKRRRRERLEMEMQENEGLRMWVEQRDAWTGAASVQKYGINKRPASDTSCPVPDACDEPSASITPAPQNQDTSILDTFDIVPVAAPLLADNPIRASITPKAYPDIFQKIVVSSRTPSVPINLADMTKALVQGWKDTNEWPPRATAPDPLAGKKRSITLAAVNGHHGGFVDRHPHLGKGVDHVKKMLHLNVHHGHEQSEGGKEG